MVAMTLLSYYYGDYNQKSYVVYMIVLGGGIFGGQFIAMAFAPMLVKKFEKKKVYNISSIASGIAFALIFVIYNLPPTSLINRYGWRSAVLCLRLRRQAWALSTYINPL